MSARPKSPVSSSPFSPRAVLGLVVIGGLAFLPFLWLIGALVVLSLVGSGLGWSAVNPVTGETLQAQSLQHGCQFLFGNLLRVE